MTFLAGSCDGALENQEDEGWNLISGHDSLKSITRLLRPNEGSLSDIAAAYFEEP